MRRSKLLTTALALQTALVGTALLASFPAYGAEPIWRFDCGTADSPVMEGYLKLTAADQYEKGRGYGWETPSAQSIVFPDAVPYSGMGGSWGQERMFRYITEECRNALNTDGVVSTDELVFRIDVPEGGRSRVAVTVGDMSQPIGSIDLRINDVLVAEHLAAWAVGTSRMFDQAPAPWWRTIRSVVDPKDGAITISLSKNQTYYDREFAKQASGENPYERWYHKTPVVKGPPYVFIGLPFVHNSIMAIEVTPYSAPVVTGNNGTDHIELTQQILSPVLKKAVEKYNQGDFAGSIEALERVHEPAAEVAKAMVGLWLAGRLETEAERTLVPQSVAILRKAISENPADLSLHDALNDAELFLKAWNTHFTRGERGKNHFIENNKAINLWLLIGEGSPLYYKSQLHLTRAARMLKPYFPTIATEAEIFKALEKKFPDSRFVRYHLHQEWENHGDGSDYFDWVMKDYVVIAGDAPEWVRAIYPAYANLVDLAEWWVTYRQEPDGLIGGGSTDDVEMVGLFGYYGYISRDASPVCIQAADKLVDTVWNHSEVDPERGYSAGLGDAEHTAESTGNTLGMMMQIDYGNPIWIERSMKTGKLIRDLWTGMNDKGRRHFKSNFLSATEVGTGDRANDSYINYRAVSPATSVLAYNSNPSILKLYTELADAWVADAMSTERSKPRGVIPAEVSWPEGISGGVNSPNWWTSTHPPGTVNYDWWSEKTNSGQGYKGYLITLLNAAYDQTRDPKYFEPLRLEYELAAKHGYKPDPSLEGPGKPKWDPNSPGAKAEPGSDLWVAARIQNSDRWLDAQRKIRGRQAALEMTRTKEYVIERGRLCMEHMRKAWPISTSEAGPTDRVGFVGIVAPFFTYTGGSLGGPLLRAGFTYENTTKDFAAAVLGSDTQGAKILYYSMASDTREIGLVPWEFEPGATYKLRYGVDEDDNETIDRAVEEREFVFQQRGQSIPMVVEPRVNYVIEIDQLQRGRPVGLYPDPAVCAEDIDYDAERGIVIATIHNVGSKPLNNLTVDFYQGDPESGGRKIGSQVIAELEAPIDLEPRTQTLSVSFKIQGPPTDIYVVLDAADSIEDEITSFNNVAHATLPRPIVELPKQKLKVSRGRGR